MTEKDELRRQFSLLKKSWQTYPLDSFEFNFLTRVLNQINKELHSIKQ